MFFAETGADRFQRRAIRPDLRVAIHANLGGRHPGKTRRLHRSVAVTAIEPHPADMMGVTEGHRLVAHLCLPAVVCRPVERPETPGAEGEHTADHDDGYARERIRTVMKRFGPMVLPTSQAAKQVFFIRHGGGHYKHRHPRTPSVSTTQSDSYSDAANPDLFQPIDAALSTRYLLSFATLTSRPTNRSTQSTQHSATPSRRQPAEDFALWHKSRRRSYSEKKLPARSAISQRFYTSTTTAGGPAHSMAVDG